MSLRSTPNDVLAQAALHAAEAREALLQRARTVQAQSGPVASPCVSICQMDAASGLCAGCLRTLSEIGAWSSLDDDGRREVWSALARRAQALPATPV